MFGRFHHLLFEILIFMIKGDSSQQTLLVDIVGDDAKCAIYYKGMT